MYFYAKSILHPHTLYGENVEIFFFSKCMKDNIMAETYNV